MADDPLQTAVDDLTRLLIPGAPAIEVYRANFANVADLDAMRFWAQQELNRIQLGFSSADDVVRILARSLQTVIDALDGTGDTGEGTQGPQGPQGPAGVDGDPGELIDDGVTARDLTWSSQEIANRLAAISSAITDLIDDASVRLDKTYSSQKIESLLAQKTNIGHTHNAVELVGEFPFTEAAYGGANTRASTALSDIGAGWQALPLVVGAINIPVLVEQDVANDGLRFLKSGVWAVSVVFTLEHDDVVAGRRFSVALYNADSTTVGEPVLAFTGRNTGGTFFSATFLVEVYEAAVGQLYQLYIGNSPDTYLTVTLEDCLFHVWRVGNNAELEAPPVPPVDAPLWSDVWLRLTFDDSGEVPGDETFTDLSDDARSVTAIGGAPGDIAFVSATELVPGFGQSVQTRPNRQIQIGSVGTIAIGTGDFLIRMKFECLTGAPVFLFALGKSDNTAGFRMLAREDNAGTPVMEYFNYTTSTQTKGTTQIDLNVVHDVALERIAGRLRLYLDGVTEIDITDNTDFTPDGTWNCAFGTAPSIPFWNASARMDDIVCAFSGLYDGDFTPPAAPLPIGP